MGKELEGVSGGTTQPVVYDVTEAKIAEMRDLYMPLTIRDLDDKEGFETVRSARIVVKGKRCAVEARRKELKADSLAWGRKVDERAKELTALLLPIEEHLEAEEGRVLAERERLKREAEEKAAAELQARVDALAAVDGSLPVAAVAAMTEEEFAAVLADATERHEAEKARLAEEARLEAERLEAERVAREEEEARKAAEREAEEKRLAEVRAEQKRIAEEQAAKEAALKAERDRIEAEERARAAKVKAEEDRLAAERQKIEDERLRAQEEAEAERQRAIRREEERQAAIREAEAKAKRDAEERAAAELWEKQEAERQAALAPDRDKLRAFATALLAVPAPELTTETAREALQDANKKLLALTSGLVRAASV